MIQQEREALFKSLALKSHPVRVQVEVTRRCNLKCIHCVLGCNAEEVQRLELSDFQRFIPQLRDAGIFLINMTGGDMFTHPDITDILNTVLESDFLVTIQTNGVLINDEHFKILDKYRAKVRCVALSLYAATPAVHEQVTGVPGSFDKTIKTARRLLDMGIPTEFSTLLMSINCHELEGIQKLCESMNISHQFYSVVVPRENGDQSPVQYRLTEEQLSLIPRPWETFTQDFDNIDPSDYTPEKGLESWCTMGRTTCYITSSGDILPCSIVSRPAGNIRNQSFGDIWNNSPVFKDIRSFKIRDFECSKCEQFPRCRPCPGLGDFEHGDIHAAPQEFCRIVKYFTAKEASANGIEKRPVLEPAGN